MTTDPILHSDRATYHRHQPSTPMCLTLNNGGKHKSHHYYISTRKWNKMMHALWGNTVTTRTARPKGRPKAAAKVAPAPPTPPRGKAPKLTPKKTVKHVSFAPGVGSPSSAAASPTTSVQSGRARLEQLIGPMFYQEPFPATGLSKYVGDIAIAGLSLHQETQALASNLKDLGQGLDSGKYKQDLPNAEMNWMDDFTKLLEEYISSLNKKANASPATKSISPISKSSSPGASAPTGISSPANGTVMERFFPTEAAGGPSQAFSYAAPAASEANSRHAAKMEATLRDNSTKSDYREWRLLSQAFAHTQAELKILESSVRDSLIASLGPQTRQAVLAQFGSKLSTKKVEDLITYLDMKFSFMSSTEDQKIIEDFENCRRTQSQTLATFLQHWRATLSRATTAGYVPSSDISNTLLARAVITDAQTTRVIEDIRQEEAALGKKLTGEARHKAVYNSLLKAAAVAEQVKLQRQSEKGPLFGKANANTAKEQATVATVNPKPKKRGRKNKASKQVNTADEDGEDPPPKPPKKKTKTDPPSTDPSPEASSLQALTTAFTGAINTAFAKGAKGFGKGAPKGAPKGSAAGGGKDDSRKGGKKGKKGRGKGKGSKGKGQFDSRNPNRLPPQDWDQSKGAWRCSACNAFNQHWKSWCSWCSKPKT